MPIYEFLCAECGKVIEAFQKLGDPPPKKCDECGGKRLSKLVSRSAFQLKGGGWYADLYASKKKGAGGEKPGEAAASGGDAPAGATAAKVDAPAKGDAPAKAKGDVPAKVEGSAGPPPPKGESGAAPASPPSPSRPGPDPRRGKRRKG